MKHKRKVTITVETERVVVMTHRSSSHTRCAKCGNEVRTVTVNEAAALAQIKALGVYKWMETGALHFTETPAGTPLICVVSLENSILSQRG